MPFNEGLAYRTAPANAIALFDDAVIASLNMAKNASGPGCSFCLQNGRIDFASDRCRLNLMNLQQAGGPAHSTYVDARPQMPSVKPAAASVIFS